ncbi:MAG: MATE family efflux transporter [Phycisphaerales bacterium JB061]
MSTENATIPTHERSPLVEMFAIAAPTIATMATYTVMQFFDGLMVSRIDPPSPVYIAAQGNGGMVSWIPISFSVGLLGVINTFVAQYFGRGEPRKGADYGWVGLWLSLILWLLLLPVVFVIPAVCGGFLGHEGQLLEYEVSYAQICLVGAVFTMIARGIAQFFFGLHKAKIPLIAASVAVTVNIAANWVLIFGHFGAPALGIKGAAIGTIIGGFCEMFVLMLVFLSPAYNDKFGTRSEWKPKLRPILDIVKLGWPAGAMITNEMICWGYLMTGLLPLAGKAAGEATGDLSGESGEIHNAVGWIALRFMHVAFMPAVGMSIALTAIIGRCMGMGRPDLAAKRTWLGLYLTVGYMGTCGLLMVIFRERAVGLFIDEGTDPEIASRMIAIGGWVMVIASVFQVFDALGMAMTGSLRGAGDTVWPGVVSVVASWLFLVLGGHLMIEYYPKLGSLGPWSAAAGYIIFVGGALFVRFLGGKWRTMKVIRHEDVPSLTQTGPDEDLTASPDALSGVTPGSP